MNVSPSNVPGMGAVTFPTKGGFGSGDIPMGGSLKLMTYLDFVQTTDKSIDDELEEIANEAENELNEKSANDGMKTPKNKGIKLSAYVKSQKEAYKRWYVQRKSYYRDKIKFAKYKEEKKILKNQFKLEVIKKKRAMAERIKNKRLQLSKKK